MVDLTTRLQEIKRMVDNVIDLPAGIDAKLNDFSEGASGNGTLSGLFRTLKAWCKASEKKIVLFIDEVDSASNNQIFLDFLAQLRGYYLKRDTTPTFQSVILAGVYDIKNIKRKLRPEEEHKRNSPWNVAADFLVDMSFSPKDISGMLADYEKDYHTGMDIDEMAKLLHDYTSGYPFLVSRLCKLIDERIVRAENDADKKSAWTKDGFLEALKLLLDERNTLFESLVNKLEDYPELRKFVYALLFEGQGIPYSPLNPAIEMAEMFGFIKKGNGYSVISNRIFETVLYNYFMSLEDATFFYISSRLSMGLEIITWKPRPGTGNARMSSWTTVGNSSSWS